MEVLERTFSDLVLPKSADVTCKLNFVGNGYAGPWEDGIELTTLHNFELFVVAPGSAVAKNKIFGENIPLFTVKIPIDESREFILTRDEIFGEDFAYNAIEGLSWYVSGDAAIYFFSWLDLEEYIQGGTVWPKLS